MPSAFSQMFPPMPNFTEQHLGDLSGKVYIVTGSSSGVGHALASMLFGAQATVYLAARSPSKLEQAAKDIHAAHPDSRGRLVRLVLDLSDLSMIRKSAEEFLAKEGRLDVLFNNAGVMTPPVGSKSAQGYDLEMGTNCLGPFLFTKFLTPILAQTAASSAPSAVRVVWLASMIGFGGPKGGIAFGDGRDGPVVLKDQMENYMQSKVGNVFIAKQLSKKAQGVVHLSVHPGILNTELQRHKSPIPPFMMKRFFKGPEFGAYSELWAGLSPEVGVEDGGRYVVPWGRWGEIPKDIAGEEERCGKEKGQENEKAKRFVEWCERETRGFE